MAKLTKRTVDALVSSGAPVFLWDDALSGFGVKALPSGAKKYLVKYRANGGGRSAVQRWLLLGSHGQLTCDQARALAQQALAAVARGLDPQEEKLQRRTAPTLADVWDRFSVEQLPRKKAGTQRDYKALWEDVLGPRLRAVKVDALSRAEVDRLHKSLSPAPYRANRALALCSRLMNLAEAWGWRDQGTNPCRFVERNPEKARTRYLSSTELKALGPALAAAVRDGDITASAANALRMLLLTGARLNEILTAKWEWVDLQKQVIHLPDSKTGAKPIYLSEAAIAVLNQQRTIAEEAKSVFIFPGRSAGKHMINLRKPWDRVCASVGISDVRLHDLRHTAASLAIGLGASLPVVGRLLGHSQPQTTQRYAHVDADPALKVANSIGEALAESLSG